MNSNNSSAHWGRRERPSGIADSVGERVVAAAWPPATARIVRQSGLTFPVELSAISTMRACARIRP
ncbi:MAG: hypothetical protein QOF35_479 [Actinomycetota bacterium]|nr:hypothetical protein [Actinomycetota bacterium]